MAETKNEQKSQEKDSRSKRFNDLIATVLLVWQSSPINTVFLITCNLISALLPAANLWVGKLLLDDISLVLQGKLGNTQEIWSKLIGLVVIQAILGVIGVIISNLQTAVRELLGDSLQNYISKKILVKSTSLELSHFENSDIYDALNRAYGEVNFRPLNIATQFLNFAQAIISLTSIVALLSSLGVGIVASLIIASIPSVIVSNRFGKENFWALRRRTSESRMQNYLGSILTSDTLVKEVRLFGFEQYLLNQWQKYYLKFRKILVSIVQRRTIWLILANFLSVILFAFATIQIIDKAIKGSISIGDFGLFTAGLLQVSRQVNDVLSSFSNIDQNLLYMQNLFEFFEIQTRDSNDGQKWEGNIQSIEFENVSFAYPFSDRLKHGSNQFKNNTDQQNVLHNLSFKISNGQALALVGENGAGKTTIVKLLTGLFRPTSGRILFNGLDINLFAPRTLQKEISIIFQDFGQYQLTVRENVGLSDFENLGEDEALKIANQRSGATEFVNQLGLEAILGKMFAGGRQLSGGQWQRLALSRLYFREASVYIFDEPTAALDARAEFEAIESLRKQAKGKIKVIISHRFSTVRLADQIIVIENGRVIENGSHEELLTKNKSILAFTDFINK